MMQIKAQPPAKKVTLVALVGLTAAGLYTATLDRWEGNVERGYRDIVGIATNCRGNTRDVVVGRVYSAAECAIINEAQAVEHIRPVIDATPQLVDHPEALAAAGSLAYNIGVAGYRKSTAARRFGAGDIRGGCLALGPNFAVRAADGRHVVQRGYVIAGSRVVQGLVNRRVYERDLCLKGLPA